MNSFFRQSLFLVICLALFSCAPSVEEYNKSAEDLEQHDQFEEAIEQRNRALEIDSNNIEALYNRGIDRSLLKDFDGSIKDFARVIALDSNHIEAFLQRGKSLNELGDYKLALLNLAKAKSLIKLNEHNTVELEEVLYERAIAFQHVDSLNAAFKDINYCIEKHYDLKDAFYLRGVLHITFGLIDDGCKDLSKAIDLNNSKAKSLNKEYCL